MNQPIIDVSDMSMCFNMVEEKTDSFKEYCMKLIRGKLYFNKFWALKDINFTMQKGEAVALIGKNGSGKSTLLKLIAGVMSPTKGHIKVCGTIAPLIELGSGFDMDLTGRENIYLNGAVMGFDHKFMDSHFDEIIDFSELGEFINVPIKNYSSGMIARLGFSIATIVKTDILIIDEILAVGDAAFQKKCHKRIETLLAGGTSLLYVSHSMDEVKAICKKALYLDHGHQIAYGPCEDVCDVYMDASDLHS
jgi:ABC-type polysaccharide/polyol phosphate transport system ATPase subunit